MTRPTSFLSASTNSSSSMNAPAEKAPPPPPPPASPVIQGDVVVILAALLCALVSLLGLFAVARGSWFRLDSWRNVFRREPSPNKGLKKKVLQSLPMFTYHSSAPSGREPSSTECAICLAEYADGDEIRVLPQCGHCFHVQCIDIWLKSRSSCPSCRNNVAVNRCRKCGVNVRESSVPGGGGGPARSNVAENEAKARQDLLASSSSS